MLRRKLGLGLLAAAVAMGIFGGTAAAGAQVRSAPVKPTVPTVGSVPAGWDWVTSSSGSGRTVTLYQWQGQASFYTLVSGTTSPGDKVAVNFVYGGQSNWGDAGFSSVLSYGQAVNSPAWTDPYGFSNCGDYVRGHVSLQGGGNVYTPSVSVCS